MTLRILLVMGLVTGTMIAACPPARSGSLPELEKFFEDEVSAFDLAVAQGTGGQAQAPAPEESWYFRNFWLRVRAKFGFDVPGLAKAQVIPEVELLWQRPLPDGSATYKP